MSLPNATKDTTEHPPKNAVAVPVNKQERDADVDRKVLLCMRLIPLPHSSSFPQLRLYGAIEAFRQGRYPSNQQIDAALQYVLERSPVDQDQLSPEGRKLIQDCRDVIETARLIVQEKNSDELFQNFLWNTNSVDLSNVKKDPNEVLVEKSKVQDDRRQGMGSLFFNLKSTYPLPMTQPHVTSARSAISLLRTLKFVKFFPTSLSLAATYWLVLPLTRRGVSALIGMPSRRLTNPRPKISSKQLVAVRADLTRLQSRSLIPWDQILPRALVQTRRQGLSMRVPPVKLQTTSKNVSTKGVSVLNTQG